MTDDDPVRLADALWRAVTYVSVAQLHLADNPLLAEPLTAAHVKDRPSGHWGTVPGTAFALSHIAVVASGIGVNVVPLLGAGHAGVAQIALAWLTGDLAAVRPQFTPDAEGLHRLVRSFPDVDGLGAEVSPLLPAGWYLGGQLGGALSFAQGAALDAPGRIVVPVLGDGECETPTTAAAWLAGRALPSPNAVLPVVHVNGHRMGGRSLLGTMDDDDIRAYAAGLGWKPHVICVETADETAHRTFHDVLISAAAATAAGVPTVVFLRCVKGWSGPSHVAGRAILDTPHTHKTPITDPRRCPEQLATLAEWLASYRPAELFAPDGTATGVLADALQRVRDVGRPHPAARARTVSAAQPIRARFGSFGDAVNAVLRRHAADGDLRVFSPDELESNRLGSIAGEPWVTEVLAEEVLLGWLAGWTGTGRRGVLISYEAFAPLMATGLVQLLKQRRLTVGTASWPSLNLLLTSYGWHNVYTHGDPSLATALLATGDPAVRVLTPADSTRLVATLDNALGSSNRVNIIVAGKHTTSGHSQETVEEEHTHGLAIWPHASDDGEPDLVLAAAGDLPAAVVVAAAPVIRRLCRARVRVVNLHDLTVLGHPRTWPAGLSETEVGHYFGATAPVLIVTLGHPAAVRGLLEDRFRRPVDVIGWREPDRPMSQRELAAAAGMDVAGLSAAAERLHAGRGVWV